MHFIASIFKSSNVMFAVALVVIAADTMGPAPRSFIRAALATLFTILENGFVYPHLGLGAFASRVATWTAAAVAAKSVGIVLCGNEPQIDGESGVFGKFGKISGRRWIRKVALCGTVVKVRWTVIAGDIVCRLK